MKPRRTPKRSLIAVAIVGALAAAYLNCLYLPNDREIAALKRQLGEAETQADGTMQLVAALGATQERLTTASQLVDAWYQSAPGEWQLSEVFERIHRLTRLAETETTRFEPQPAIAYETFLRIPLLMECQGSFAQLAAVLTGLENMPEPIWVTSIEVQSTGQAGEISRAQINLEVFADNLEDSDQEELSGEPITLEADRISQRL
jgi:Tfp pilus assembly protein PilO